MNPVQKNVGDSQYNIAPAAALEQKTLLGLIGPKIAMSSATAQIEKINSQLVFGVLIAMDEPTFDKIAGIVLWKTVKSGSAALVAVDDFQNKINDYYLLVAEAVMVNLADFFTYLDAQNAETRKSSE